VDNTVREIRTIQSKVDAPIFGDMPELLICWSEARVHMAQRFNEDARFYLDPVRYLRIPERFVASPKFLATTSDLLDRDGNLSIMRRAQGRKPIFGRKSQAAARLPLANASTSHDCRARVPYSVAELGSLLCNLAKSPTVVERDAAAYGARDRSNGRKNASPECYRKPL
jgi:hypothetical protein